MPRVGFGFALGLGVGLPVNLTPTEYIAYINQALEEGTISGDNAMQLGIYRFLIDKGLYTPTRLLISPGSSYSKTTSGIYDYYSRIIGINNPEPGVQLVVNPEFTIDDNWTKTSSSIANQIATINTGGNIAQTLTITTGLKYKLQLDILSNTATSVSVTLGGSTKVLTGIGTKIIFIDTISTGNLIIALNGTGLATIDLVNTRLSTVDLIQTTELSQPYISGDIAPNETLALKNVNGGSRYMTHPIISFTANEAWSVTTCFNYIGTLDYSALFGKSDTSVLILNGNLGFQANFVFVNASNNNISLGSRLNILNKNSIVTFTASGNGVLKFYINGVFIDNYTITTNITLSRFLGREVSTAKYYGNAYYYRIQSGALTPTQVTEEYNLLRSYIPEIESVDIGTKTWATSNLEVVATPTGNVIPNVTLGGAVEKITNAADREFSSDTGFWIKGNTWSISGGQVHVNGSAEISYLTRNTLITSGKWYKITIDIKALSSGNVYFRLGNALSTYYQTTGIKVAYVKSDGVNFSIRANAGVIADFDDLSVQELNWANSKELYDGLIAQGYTVANALKECAMWCYPNNNDLPTGSWAGKLYNKYAVDLLKADMLTANFGWHIATEADKADLLATYPDVDDLKKEGTDYWTSANGTNDSGLTLLGTGTRLRDGTFTAVKETGGFWTEDGDEFPQVGLPIRLVKD